MNNNVFCFGDTYFLQKNGTVMEDINISLNDGNITKEIYCYEKKPLNLHFQFIHPTTLTWCLERFDLCLC